VALHVQVCHVLTPSWSCGVVIYFSNLLDDLYVLWRNLKSLKMQFIIIKQDIIQ
jgi:hypothetical protein